MSLHNEIMNIQVDESKAVSMVSQTAYKYGHRDARHAAAEMALKYERALEEAIKGLKSLSLDAGLAESDDLVDDAAEVLSNVQKILEESD